jgi:hypothetical protein
MLRKTNCLPRIFVLVILAGGLFGMAMGNSAHAAAGLNPLQQPGSSETPTLTASDTSTDTPVFTSTITPSATRTRTPTRTPTRTRTPTKTRKSTSTRTPSPTITPSSTYTPTNTGTLPTHTPSAPNRIVISEFRTLSPAGLKDEFVELYNPTGAAVNIGYWQLSKSSGCGNTITTLATIPYATILQPGQHYLLASTNNSLPSELPDQTYNPGTTETGGLAIVSSGNVIDQVGMSRSACTATYYHEGNYLPFLMETSDQSYKRKPGGDNNTSCYDTNNNANDFMVRSPANPQNTSSESTLCDGVVPYTLTPTPTRTRTRTPTLTRTRTPSRTPTSNPGAAAVLNEFLPHPQTDWNSDGTANVGDEYIEVINVSPNVINLRGWRLDTGIESVTTFSLPDTTLQPREIAAFFGSTTGLSLSDGGGTVRLLRSDGHIIDAYTYPAVEIADQTWCRLPDGTGTWGFTCRPSPGRPNTNSSTGASSAVSICSQGSAAPEWLIFAECGNFGSGISSDLVERVFWLKNRWKWDVFLE